MRFGYPLVGPRSLVKTYEDGGTFVIGKVSTWDPPHHLAVGW